MKISCVPVSLLRDLTSGEMTVLDWIKLARQSGLDGLDLSAMVIPREPGEQRVIRRQLEENGLQAVMLVCGADMTDPNPRQRQAAIADMWALVDAASALGCRYLRVVAGQAHPGLSRRQGIRLAVDAINRIADYAFEHGILLAYENHYKSVAWQYNDFSQDHKTFLEILNGCNPERVGVNFDTANPLVINEDPLELLDQVYDRIVSIHVNDLQAAGSFDPVLIGTGVVPLKAIFSRLQSYGYDGWLCIEEYSNTGQQAIAQAADWVRATWLELLSGSAES